LPGAVGAAVAHRVRARLRQRQLEIREAVGVDRLGPRQPAEREPPEDQVLRPCREAEAKNAHRLLLPWCSMPSRILSSERRIRRDTCICEMPTSAAISDCVSPA